MITYFVNGVRHLADTLSEPVTSLWFHLQTPSNEDIDALANAYNFDELIIRDIKDSFEVPRFEQSGTVAYFFTRFLNNDERVDVDTSPILFVLTKDRIVTVADIEPPFLQAFLAGKRMFVGETASQVFMEMISHLISSYGRFLNSVRKSVQRDVARVQNMRARDMQRLVLFEQELNEILSALLPTNTWLQQLTRSGHARAFISDKEMLEDLLIASSQLVDSAKTILKTIQNIRNASDAFLTQKLNSTIRALTAFTIVLAIPTLIASLFGMNVSVPLAHNPQGFWVILGIVMVTIGVTMYFFVHSRWL